MLNIDKDSLLICNNYFKNKILKYYFENKKIIDFKIMNINEFISNLTFKYNTKTIYYIIKKYKVKYEIALIYLQNMIYINNEYDDEKFNFLYDLKKELICNNLLKENKEFKEYIKNKKIIFYNINYDLKFLKEITRNLNTTFIEFESKEKYEKEILHFETINEEIIYVGSSIIEKINSGILCSNIKIVGLPTEYKYLIKMIFDNLNLYINIDNTAIYSTEICKYFLDNLKEDISETIKLVSDKYKNSDIINKIIDICNKYTWCDNFIEIKELLIYEFKHNKVNLEKYNNEIEIIDHYDIDIDSDNYYYLLGFNNENIPVSYKDTEYISDKLCTLINKETSNERYLREKNLLISKIQGAKNLIITYKDKTNFDEYLISNLNNELNYKVIDKCADNDISYSKILSHLKLCKLLDRYEKYGEKSNELEKLYTSINTDYKTYDNKFSGIEKNDLYEYLDNKLLLSYTSIDNYYKCAFKYYIKNILKLDEYEQSFSAYIGSFMHYILSKYTSNNFDYEIEKEKFINENNYKLNAKEEFFLNKIDEYLKFIIDGLKYQKTLTAFDNEIYEEKIILEKENKIKITLMGVIDKIMYMNKDGNTYLSIVDYKTGSIDTGLKNNEDGLNLQLPIYAYLVSKSNLFDNPIISGLYYQKLMDNEIKETTLEEYLKEKRNNLKLQGISTNNESILGLFDSTYENSDLIKGMKLTSSGFSAYSKVFSDAEMENMIDTANKKIDECIEKIVSGNFDINPKQIKFENIGCKYCEYKDLCFRKEENIVLLKEGDESARLD